MANHSLKRTSPKGGPFFGTCIRCGTENLPAKAVQEECTNPHNISDESALLTAIRGDS